VNDCGSGPACTCSHDAGSQGVESGGPIGGKGNAMKEMEQSGEGDRDACTRICRGPSRNSMRWGLAAGRRGLGIYWMDGWLKDTGQARHEVGRGIRSRWMSWARGDPAEAPEANRDKYPC
jgi:hypothetical protein